MSANQRRPGFRLPWVAGEGGNSQTDSTDQPAGAEKEGGADASAPVNGGTPGEPVTAQESAPSPAAASASTSGDDAPTEQHESETPTAQDAQPGDGAQSGEDAEPGEEGQAPEEISGSSTFLNELVAAMRGVAEHARETGLSELKGRADEYVSRVQSASEERASGLRGRADADVAEIGEWAKREAERIREEAERRVSERRTQLDEQLAAETRRAEQESKGLRIRVAEYERQLEAYYTRLTQIDDPAAFVAAAKRIPQPPQLGDADAAVTEDVAIPVGADAAAVGEAAPTDAAEPSTPTAESGDAGDEGEAPASPHAAGLGDEMTDESIPQAPASALGPEPQEPDEDGNITTSVVVTGLASFGAITGFRQSLAGVDGVRSVQLSLGPTGEFLYRAAHTTEIDLAEAIGSLEGEAATVERDPTGTLRVVISRAR